MGNLTQNDMTVVIVLIGLIVVLLTIIAILDIISKKKKKEEQMENISFEEDKEELIEEVFEEKLPIELPVTNYENSKPFTNKPNHVQEIKYVEEDEELEKTKAKIELAELKEELKRQEELKQQEQSIIIEESPVEITVQEETKTEEDKTEIIEIENESEKTISEAIEIIDIEETKTISEITKQDVSDIATAINVELAKLEENNLQKAIEVQEDLNEILEINKESIIAMHEDEQERKAIISVEEFNKISDEMYDSNEAIQMAYEDEGNEPISLTELENLYNTREMTTVKLDDFETIKIEEKEEIIKNADIKKMEDLPPIAIDKKFKSSPFISPVYGISETKETIELEQTANLDKLNEEIKKTNEFLKTLKELQKNLD